MLSIERHVFVLLVLSNQQSKKTNILQKYITETNSKFSQLFAIFV